MRRAAALAIVALAAGAAGAAGDPAAPKAGAAAKPAPSVQQLVVFRSGKAIEKRVRARATKVSVGRKRCAVPAATPLAALVRSDPGRMRLEDFAACGRRARDAVGLYVKRIRGDGERGAGGWVYKIGRKTPGIGAADPTRRLRKGQRVTWFLCKQSGNCQRSLELRLTTEPGGVVNARVTGYDDNGRGVPIGGATVAIGSMSFTTDDSGFVRATVPAGSYRAHAEKAGLVRSFSERVVVG